MKINFFYNLKKVFNKIEALSFRHYAIEDNIFLLNKNHDNIRSVLLYFPDYEMMHFGDHLFFEPLAKYLNMGGYQVTIAPVKHMEFYFRDLGYRVKSEGHFDDIDLIITRVEFIKALRRSKKQVLFIDTASSKIERHLCNDMIEKVSQFLGMSNVGYDPIPSYPDSLGIENLSFLNMEKKYIVFNNYVDSGSVRVGSRHQKILIDFIKELKVKTGFDVIHTGSIKDKASDSRFYDFVDIDARGETSVRDLFALCSLGNVLLNVSFDGLQMHLFFMKNKKSFILFRGRFLKKNADYIKKYVNPPFFTDSINDIIEYI